MRKMRFSTLRFILGIATVLSLTVALLIPANGMALEMKAGTAKGIVTPEKLLNLTAGKLDSGVMLPTTGKEHELYARVLTLFDGTNRLVIVTYDMNSLDVATPILRERCKKEMGLDPAFLILMCTHNHQAPMPRLIENFPHQRWLAERIYSLIKEAIAAEKGPVNLYFGTGQGYFVRNSENAPVDYEIQVIKVIQGKQPVALLFNQPTHPIHSARTKIDVGHPGYAMDELEKMFPGMLPLYADACGGNQFPIASTDSSYASVPTVRAFGVKLAQAVRDIAAGPMVDVTGPITSMIDVVSLPLAPPLSYEEALKLAKGIPLDIGYNHATNRGTNWIRVLLKHYKEGIPFPTKSGDLFLRDEGYVYPQPDDSRQYPNKVEEVIVAKIGQMPLVALQGEVCASIGMRIKDAFRTQRPIMVFAYMGEQNVYIPTRESVRTNDYQARVVQMQYASPVGWAPEVEDEMVNGTIKLIKQVIGK
jgi:neutral ceramidase